MNSQELIEAWKIEEQRPFSGWDFSYLDGKMFQEQPPWSYPARAAELMRKCSSMVDMGTGGGELLSQLRADWPPRVAATEAYPPNQELARQRLSPLGVRVEAVDKESDLGPFKDAEFELVINRHADFDPAQVARVLATGGVFLTQQVHGLSSLDLLAQFGAKPAYPQAVPEYYAPKLKAAGLRIIDLREWAGNMKFIDIASLVYYLKATPWLAPGFSVETHLESLLSLQRRGERGDELVFGIRRYLIEAVKG